MRKLIALGVLLAVVLVVPGRTATAPGASLDGAGNNVTNPSWGRAGSLYLRLAPVRYTDGIGAPVAGVPSRYISNRIFNDAGQNLFSENGVSQWGWVWGQFVDHDFALRRESGGERRPIPFAGDDPLEEFTNDLRVMDFSRTLPLRGSGRSSPREYENTLTSYIDGSGLYGVDEERLDWLRVGSLDGKPDNNSAQLLLPGGMLPRTTARAGKSPAMDLFGPLRGRPEAARVAGDRRANENLALTAAHTLFAREHNRIVAALPDSLSDEERFQIARRVVAAEIQFITYEEFLPALGVELAPYRGYDATVNASIANEFSVVGYRSHSMVHGVFDVFFDQGEFSNRQLVDLRARGIAPRIVEGRRSLQIPLNVGFGNPDLLEQVGIGRFLFGLGVIRQYRNDEQIDNALRSVLFKVPRPGVADPSVCGRPTVRAECFTGVADLGAIDIERGRDHGMASYNELRRAYGLAPKRSFTEITGEVTDRFPAQSAIDAERAVDDPNILDFVRLLDEDGRPIAAGSLAAEENAITGIRRTTLAARLKATFGAVGSVDAFVGMLSEPHIKATEFGELQRAIWTRQFTALRDGDRFFYRNDPVLETIRSRYGISYRTTLAQIIERNTDARVAENVFFVPDAVRR